MDCCSGGFSGNVEVASSPATLVSTPFPWPNKRRASKRACWLGTSQRGSSSRILIRCGVVGRGRVFPPPVGVALIIFDSVCCTSITKRFLGLKRERAGSSWPMSSHPITHPPSSLISSLALLPSPQKTPSVGRHRVAPPAARFCLPSLVAALEFLFFFGGHFQMEISAEIEKFFDFRSLKVYDSRENEDK